VLRFLVDENLPRTLARDLVSAGYEATHARDVGLGGRPDRDLYDYAVAHNSIIVTCDLGFADQRRFPTGHSGIVLVRLPDDTPIDKRRHRVLSVLSSFDDGELRGALIVIDPGGVRVRRGLSRE
jgi:predicted nuclease of predicted toxin-antitoxin system